MPWSDFRDYVQSKDGKVFLAISFYSRVLCYDSEGNFLASYPYPFGNAKGAELATDEHNNIYFRTQHQVYVYDTSWNLKNKYEGNFRGPRIFLLNEKGKPECVPEKIRVTVPNRAVKPGEYLFASYEKRTSFQCEDGTYLLRTGNLLKRHDVNGNTIGIYRSPVVLSCFAFPWPGILAWPAVIILAFLRKRRKSFHESDDVDS